MIWRVAHPTPEEELQEALNELFTLNDALEAQGEEGVIVWRRKNQ